MSDRHPNPSRNFILSEADPEREGIEGGRGRKEGIEGGRAREGRN